MNDARTDLAVEMSHYWWMIGLRGLVAVIFGVIAFLRPGMTLVALVLLFGAYALANGVLALIHAFSAPKGCPRSSGMILGGLISIAAGIVAFARPGFTTLALVMLIAIWAIVNGVFEIVSAIRLRKLINNEWLLVLAGVLSVLFGLVVLFRPAVGAIALVWWIGGFAVVFGVLLIGLAFRMRHWDAHHPVLV
jgi:uncharacterized membrane protein HdeD (DUF308 family)